MTPSTKLEYEYRCFFLDQMRTSRENIFACSHEIEMKKQIRKQLLKILETIDEGTGEKLLLLTNMIESAFRFIEDAGRKEDMEAQLSEWLSFVTAA